MIVQRATLIAAKISVVLFIQLRYSCIHAKKKENHENGNAECGGQEPSAANYEEGSPDQAPKEQITRELIEVMLANQSSVLELLREMKRILAEVARMIRTQMGGD